MGRIRSIQSSGPRLRLLKRGLAWLSDRRSSKELLPVTRFPAPWTVEAIKAGFKIVDANGQSIAYVYGHSDPRDAGVANSLSLDEARRIASNIAKLPALLPCK